MVSRVPVLILYCARCCVKHPWCLSVTPSCRLIKHPLPITHYHHEGWSCRHEDWHSLKDRGQLQIKTPKCKHLHVCLGLASQFCQWKPRVTIQLTKHRCLGCSWSRKAWILQVLHQPPVSQLEKSQVSESILNEASCLCLRAVEYLFPAKGLPGWKSGTHIRETQS